MEIIEKPRNQIKFCSDRYEEIFSNLSDLNFKIRIHYSGFVTENFRPFVCISIVNAEKDFFNIPNPNYLSCSDEYIRFINYKFRRLMLTDLEKFLIPVDLETMTCEIKDFKIVKCSQDRFIDMVENIGYINLDNQINSVQDMFNQIKENNKIYEIRDSLMQQVDKCRIKIDLLFYDKEKGQLKYFLDSIYTEIIYDSFPQCAIAKRQFDEKINFTITNRNNPRILRVSQNHGSIQGNDAIFLFLTYFDPNDLKVEFYELDSNGNICWSSYATFNAYDSHVNFSLVIYTPKYTGNFDKTCLKKKKVNLRLYRPSDSLFSEKFDFYYCLDGLYDLRTLFKRVEDKVWLMPKIPYNKFKRQENLDEKTNNVKKLKTIDSVQTEIKPTNNCQFSKPVISSEIQKNKYLIDKMNFLTDRIGKSIIKFSINRSVHDLIKAHRYLLKQTDENGNNPIHLSILNKNFDLTEIFVDVGSTLPNENLINIRNHLCLTPLLISAHLGEWELSDFLLEANADISVSDYDGNNSFHIACKNNDIKLLQTLIKHLNIKRNYSSLNSINNEGYSPLHLAVLNQSSEMVEELLNVPELKINLKDKKIGFTSLHYAAKDPFGLKILYVLVKNKKIDVNVKSHIGYTPLFLSVLNKNYLSTIILLKNGADPNIETDIPYDLNLSFLNSTLSESLNEKKNAIQELFEKKNDEYLKLSQEIKNLDLNELKNECGRKYFLTNNETIISHLKNDDLMKEIFENLDNMPETSKNLIIKFEQIKHKQKKLRQSKNFEKDKIFTTHNKDKNKMESLIDKLSVEETFDN